LRTHSGELPHLQTNGIFSKIFWGTLVRKIVVLAPVLFLCVALAHAQQGDFAFGVGTLLAPSASSASSNFSNQSMGGGTFLAVSGDGLIKYHLGVGAEVAWRATQNTYGGFEPFRPILYDFNVVWAPQIQKHIGLELLGGIGASSTRFYTPYFACDVFVGCTNYSSSTHFMGDFGGGLKLYLHGGLFLRPEARVYLIHNNFEFNSGHAERVGVSLGYTFGGSELTP
jgi:hypothetical protein